MLCFFSQYFIVLLCVSWAFSRSSRMSDNSGGSGSPWNTLMNRSSVSRVTSWLSSFPRSDPGGLDSMSGAACSLPSTLIRQRRVYTRSHALIRLPEHLALMAAAPRKYRSTRRTERSASECSDGARNPGTQVLRTKLTKLPKHQCRAERAEQRLRGATRGPKDQGGQVYKRRNGA